MWRAVLHYALRCVPALERFVLTELYLKIHCQVWCWQIKDIPFKCSGLHLQLRNSAPKCQKVPKYDPRKGPYRAVHVASLWAWFVGDLYNEFMSFWIIILKNRMYIKCRMMLHFSAPFDRLLLFFYDQRNRLQLFSGIVQTTTELIKIPTYKQPSSSDSVILSQLEFIFGIFHLTHFASSAGVAQDVKLPSMELSLDKANCKATTGVDEVDNVHSETLFKCVPWKPAEPSWLHADNMPLSIKTYAPPAALCVIVFFLFSFYLTLLVKLMWKCSQALLRCVFPPLSAPPDGVMTPWLSSCRGIHLVPFCAEGKTSSVK